MEYVVAYFFVTYSIVVVSAVRMLKLRLARPLAVKLVIAALLGAPLAPYGVVQIQTPIFKDALLKPARAEHMVFDNSSVVCDAKVLRVLPRSALLYVVVSDKIGTDYAGFTVRLVRSGGEWKYCGDIDCIWSDSGSAHGNVFPPYAAKGDWD